MHAWHDDRRVERDRYAGLLAAGVTDAATLEASSAGCVNLAFSLMRNQRSEPANEER